MKASTQAHKHMRKSHPVCLRTIETNDFLLQQARMQPRKQTSKPSKPAKPAGKHASQASRRRLPRKLRGLHAPSFSGIFQNRLVLRPGDCRVGRGAVIGAAFYRRLSLERGGLR
jgi:hypothetical protein